MKKVRILIADNDARVRSALSILLKQEPDLALVGESADLESLLDKARELKPDLFLLDWDLPGRSTAALLYSLCARSIQPRVIVLGQRPECERAALAAGADAFVSKADPPERLLTVLRRLVKNFSLSDGGSPAVNNA